MKINWIKVLTVLGAGLSLGGTIVSAVASDKKQTQIIGKIVDEKLAQK